jgi:hypothetical protein
MSRGANRGPNMEARGLARPGTPMVSIYTGLHITDQFWSCNKKPYIAESLKNETNEEVVENTNNKTGEYSECDDHADQLCNRFGIFGAN